MHDRTQPIDRPSRRVLTSLAIAAGGGVIALFFEYFVLQDLLAPEPHPWKSNGSPTAINGVSAHGEIAQDRGIVRIKGTLWDKADDKKGVLLIIAVDDGKNVSETRVPHAQGAHRPMNFEYSFPSSVKSITVSECLTHPTKSNEIRDCSDEPLVIWPYRAP
ncbi:hypothetical protein E1161_03180 [Saccharopolyspora aridisoli]|uniref:Uncharacterized protein n=1 Tax=Saccharopolyspora aridisoli TaxID=2530385 RepID=A0A4R4UTP3_9PSEU|nr:hypothetical protein [Saccharopolyspora aridisoli]TDC95807.1 hypothetical protein E1161_03180 [Saccharopolyspora aridisoli]